MRQGISSLKQVFLSLLWNADVAGTRGVQPACALWEHT